MAFDLTYFFRYNERIVVPASTIGGVSGTGAISSVLTVNLAPDKVLISDAVGKIAVSNASATEVSYSIGVTSPIQTQLNGKESTLTKGNLSESTSSILTITGGTAAIIGSGLSIQVKQASTGQSGYLSSTDWNTFNNKISPALNSGFVYIGNGSNVATPFNTTTGDILASTSTGLTIKNSAITNVHIAAASAITRTKLAIGTAYRILANNSSGVISENAALTASQGVVIDANGQLVASASSAAQVGYLSTTIGDVQVQIDNKIATRNVSAIVKAPTVTQNLWAIMWDNTANQYILADPILQGIPAGGTTRQFLGKNSATIYDSSWLSLVTTDITDITSSAAELNKLTGVTTTPTQFNFLNTATEDIQAALNVKQSYTLGLNSIWVGNASSVAQALVVGSNGQVLGVSGGVVTWVTPGTGGTVTSVQVSGGTTGLSFTGGPISTTGTMTMAGTLLAVNGGTSFTTYAAGDLIYASAVNTLSKLTATTNGFVLTLSAGLPVWAASGGSLTGLTTNRIPYATGSTSLGDDSAHTWDNTNKALTISTVRISALGSQNTFIGFGSGNFTLSSAADNVGIGRNTLSSLTTGVRNVAIGTNSGSSSTSGQNNVSIGYLALDVLTTGTANIAIGSNALGGLTTTSNNIGIGSNSLLVTSGGNNVALGNSSGAALSTGTQNIIIGDAACSSTVLTGTQNIVVGWGVEPQSASANGQLSIQNIIFGTGNSATGTSSSTGKVSIGGPPVTDKFEIWHSGTQYLGLTTDGRLYGKALHNNAGSITGTTNQYVASGTYTPTLTNTTNVSASTASVCQYIRVGNVVTVSGSVDITPTSGATVSTNLDMSLPIASTFTLASQGGGACSDPFTPQSGSVNANSATGKAVFSFKSATTSSRTFYFTFTYVIV